MKKSLTILGCSVCMACTCFMFAACGGNASGSTDLSEVNQQISQLEQQIQALQNDKTTLTQQITALQTTIAILRTQIGTSTGSSSLQEQLTAALGRLTVLENQLGGSETNSFYSIGDKVTYTVNGSKVFDFKPTQAFKRSELESPRVVFTVYSYLGSTESIIDNKTLGISANLYVPSLNQTFDLERLTDVEGYQFHFNPKTQNIGSGLMFVYSNYNLVAIYNLQFPIVTA